MSSFPESKVASFQMITNFLTQTFMLLYHRSDGVTSNWMVREYASRQFVVALGKHLASGMLCIAKCCVFMFVPHIRIRTQMLWSHQISQFWICFWVEVTLQFVKSAQTLVFQPTASGSFAASGCDWPSPSTIQENALRCTRLSRCEGKYDINSTRNR